ncbi:MAG: TlpA family protein disulfide reductase [Solirubrobacterales bacterium]|nr:TlpA family protein disulfide reductase [Solirubrobacterales bacterium]
MKRSAVPSVALVVAAALVALLVYGVAVKGTDTTLDDAVKRGELPVAPGAAMMLPRLGAAGKVSLKQLRGKVVVLNFWASWCPPCQDEAPVLERAQKSLAADGAGTVLGATYNDASVKSLDFVRKHDLSYPNLRDVGTALAKQYGTRTLPETFILDRRGRIVGISRGEVQQDFMDDALAKARASS